MSMTQTALPKSPALCGGAAATAARADMTTDEREIQARSVLDSLHKHIALLDANGCIV